MRNKKVLAPCLLMLVCCLVIDSCSSKSDGPATYPDTTLLGERTLAGKIVSLPNPPTSPTDPALPGMVLGLKTACEEYILTCDGRWQFHETLTIDGVTYSPEDKGEVEITGMASSTKISASQEYFELEIKTIKKLGTSD